MSVLIIPPGRKNAWKSKIESQIVLGCVWEQLSNRTEPTKPVANGAGLAQLPDSVVAYVSDSFKPGVQFVVCPSMSSLYKRGSGGHEPAQGTEESPEMQYKKIHYNVQRKALAIRDDSVDGDMTKAYPIMEQKNDLMKDWFVVLSDYNYNRTILEGGDEFLTEARYWTGQSITTPPVIRVLHPNIYYRGASTKVPYNADLAVYNQAVADALNAAFPNPDTIFDLTALEAMVNLAVRNVQRLSWRNGKSGNSSVDYVIMLSQTQAEQLATKKSLGADNTASWNQLFREADIRGDGKNKAITGVLGVYKTCLILANPRQSLFNCEDVGATGGPVHPDTGTNDGTYRNQYVKPWVDANITPTSFLFRGDNRLPIEKGGATNSFGTCETAVCLGRGSVASAIVKSLDFNTDMKDYNFSTGYEARRSQGCERMDWYATVGGTPVNWSSFVYFTPTPATLY